MKSVKNYVFGSILILLLLSGCSQKGSVNPTEPGIVPCAQTLDIPQDIDAATRQQILDDQARALEAKQTMRAADTHTVQYFVRLMRDQEEPSTAITIYYMTDLGYASVATTQSQWVQTVTRTTGVRSAVFVSCPGSVRVGMQMYIQDNSHATATVMTIDSGLVYVGVPLWAPHNGAENKIDYRAVRRQTYPAYTLQVSLPPDSWTHTISNYTYQNYSTTSAADSATVAMQSAQFVENSFNYKMWLNNNAAIDQSYGIIGLNCKGISCSYLVH